MKITDSTISSPAKGASAPALAAVSGAARRVLRVWVVDDNPALSELLSQLLSQQPGLKCQRRFPSAETVIAALTEERPPDIILLDINLGQKNGLSAIRPIRKLAPSVRVLMMTMFSNSYYEAEAHRAGAAGFLLKSYEISDLVQLIQAAYHTPGAPGLFPNIALRENLQVGVDQGSEEVARFDLMRGLRRLYRAARRQPAG